MEAPPAGALNGGCSAPFTDGEGPHGASTLSVDLPLNENYNPDLGYRTSAAASENTANAFPMFWEPIVNCPWGESTQYYLFAPRVEGGAGPMGGVPVAPMSPDGLRGIGWLGTVYDLHDVLWYTYNKLGSGSPGPSRSGRPKPLRQRPGPQGGSVPSIPFLLHTAGARRRTSATVFSVGR